MDAPPLRMKCAGNSCAHDGCERAAEKLMLCAKHYAARDRTREDRGRCASPGCAGNALGRKGLCNKHYLAQYRRGRTIPCLHCGRPSVAKQLCAAHFSREKRGHDMSKPLVPRYNGKLCSQLGCAGKAQSVGLCKMHYMRLRDGVPLDAPPRAPTIKSYIDDWGYVKTVCPDGKHRSAHRMAMEESLGRPLLRKETVHHKNGQRTDNRLVRGHELQCPGTCCNLELWSRAQPSGQRVRDKLAWAHELIKLYGALPPEEQVSVTE